MRTTYRTARVLSAIGSAPRSSNREIAAASGILDEGQASKLLGRLERRGMITNVGLGAGFGEPNAWLLTARGRHLAQMSRHDAPGPSIKGGHARQGGGSCDLARRPDGRKLEGQGAPSTATVLVNAGTRAGKGSFSARGFWPRRSV